MLPLITFEMCLAACWAGGSQFQSILKLGFDVMCFAFSLFAVGLPINGGTWYMSWRIYVVPFDRTKTITEESIGALMEQLQECRTKISGLLPVDVMRSFNQKQLATFLLDSRVRLGVQ